MRTTTLALLTTLALSGAAGAADLSKPAPPAAADAVERAALLVARQSWPAAAASYRQALAAAPNDASLHNRLGICYQHMGDAKAARAEYKRAIALRKDYAEAYNNLGAVEHARGRYKQAIGSYAEAIRINPGDPVFYKNLGAAWLAREDVGKALEAWNEALRLDPAIFDRSGAGVPGGGLTLARQYFLYAKLLASRGEVEKALEFLTRAQAAGFREFASVESDRDFATIVKDPRYVALK
jgi:tetratricopeptide (TPR) repeat protein